MTDTKQKDMISYDVLIGYNSVQKDTIEQERIQLKRIDSIRQDMIPYDFITKLHDQYDRKGHTVISYDIL